MAPKHSFLLLAFMITSMANSQIPHYQNYDIVTMDPVANRGFLAWVEDTSASYYGVEIFKSNFDINFQYVNSESVWRTEVWDQLYIKIPDVFWMNEDLDKVYKCKLTIYDNGNNELKDTWINIDRHAHDPSLNMGPELPDPRVKGCSWVCSGPNWAYRIQGWEHPGNAIYRIENANYGESGNAFGYWHYMTFDQFSNLHEPENIQFSNDWYNIADNGYWTPNSDGSPIYSFPNPEGQDFYDQNGWPIPGDNVYLIKKPLGFWENPEDIDEFYQTDEILNPEQTCLNDIYGMNDILNNPEHSNLPEFVDAAQSGDLILPNNFHTGLVALTCPAGADVYLPDHSENDCYTPLPNYDYNGDDLTNIYDWLYYYAYSCPKIQVSDYQHYLDAVLGCIINTTNDNNSIYSVSHANFFDEDGTFLNPEIDIDKGLIAIDMFFTDNQHARMVFEATQPYPSNLPLSDFLDVTIFPNPISSDQFSVNMIASAKLTVTYELFDFLGNRIYTQNYALQDEHNANHSIKVNTGIPQGMLINKFTLEDGSYISITTVKN